MTVLIERVGRTRSTTLGKQQYWLIDGEPYGPFTSLPNGLPNPSEVYEWFLVKQKLTGKTASQLLAVTPRMVNQMKQTFPQKISRRETLAKTLGIPFGLFGLAQLDQKISPLSEKERLVSQAPKIDDEGLLTYKELREIYWQIHYTGVSAKAIPQIEARIQKLTDLLPESGYLQSQVITELAAYHELVARMLSDSDQQQLGKIHLFKALGYRGAFDTETLGRLLYRLGLLGFEQQKFSEADVVLDHALTLVEKVSVPLRASFILQSALVQSHLSMQNLPHVPQKERQVRKAFDEAQRWAQHIDCIETEGVRMDLGRFYTAYGEGLLNFCLLDEAEQVLTEAERHTHITLTKRLMFVQVQRLRLAIARQDWKNATYKHQDLVVLARKVDSTYTLNKLKRYRQYIPAQYL